jgi:hypothetical protein
MLTTQLKTTDPERWRYWFWFDIHCWHWPHFHRGLTDQNGHKNMKEWEAAAGPLHFWRVFT